MNQLLRVTFNRTADLLSEKQDRFARFLLDELTADRKRTGYSSGRNLLSC